MLVLFQASEDNFFIMTLPVPKEVDNEPQLHLFISWNDPEPHQIDWVIDGWDKRKVPQEFVIDRSGMLDEGRGQLILTKP